MITIRRVDNGYIMTNDYSDYPKKRIRSLPAYWWRFKEWLRSFSEPVEVEQEIETNTLVFTEDEMGGKQPLVHMLYSLVDILGEAGSRYDKERVTIRLRPGDKYEPRPGEEVPSEDEDD